MLQHTKTYYKMLQHATTYYIMLFFIFDLFFTFYEVSENCHVTCCARRSRDLARKTRHLEFDILNLDLSTTFYHTIWHFWLVNAVFNLSPCASKCSAVWSASWCGHFPTKFVHFGAIAFLMFSTYYNYRRCLIRPGPNSPLGTMFAPRKCYFATIINVDPHLDDGIY